MIEIKNLKIFIVNVNCKYHWSKLPKFNRLMREQIIKFPLDAHLRGANLRGAILEGADLAGAYLRGADLIDTDLIGAHLRSADLRGAVLEGAYLRGADLRSADLTGADLRGAVLDGADLRRAYLRGADLTGTDLRGAVLEGTDLTGAYLRGADLKGAEEKYPEKLLIMDFCSFDRFGSCNRQTVFFLVEKIGIIVQCGCFYGTIKEFKKQVKETHRGNNYEKCYLQMAKLAELRLEGE